MLLEGEVKLDETTTPRQLDWVKLTGAYQQEFPPLLAIYTIDGDPFMPASAFWQRPCLLYTTSVEIVDHNLDNIGRIE